MHRLIVPLVISISALSAHAEILRAHDFNEGDKKVIASLVAAVVPPRPGLQLRIVNTTRRFKAAAAQGEIAAVKERNVDGTDEAIADLERRNTITVDVPSFDLRGGVGYVPASKIEDVLNDRDAAWTEKSVLLQVSLPGYSNDGRTAAVRYLSLSPYDRGFLYGVGLAIFRHEEGKWLIYADATEPADLERLDDVTADAPPAQRPAAAEVYFDTEARMDAVNPVRVGGDVRAPVVINRVEPVYTAAAKDARIQGIVILEIIIDRNGRVRDAIVLKPLPYGLDAAAVEAVKQWTFRPGTLAGQPVDVIFNLTMSFKLED